MKRREFVKTLGAAAAGLATAGCHRKSIPSRDNPQTECLRADGWKYIRYPQHPEFEELYELTSDPHESRNLAGDPARGGILNDYRQRCRERADKAGRAGERM
jgi:arylsulfatase A-like enzyme